MKLLASLLLSISAMATAAPLPDAKLLDLGFVEAKRGIWVQIPKESIDLVEFSLGHIVYLQASDQAYKVQINCKNMTYVTFAFIDEVDANPAWQYIPSNQLEIKEIDVTSPLGGYTAGACKQLGQIIKDKAV